MSVMNKLSHEDRCAVIRCLCEGCSIRSTVRITGVAKNTIQKLTREVGEACLKYQDKVFHGLTVQRAQIDELWCFCYAKDKNLPDNMRDDPSVGSIWTWTCMDADTKLIFSWRLGSRDASVGQEFMNDVASRVHNRMQLTTDGHAVYMNAVYNSFGVGIDYAQLVKIYGTPSPEEVHRYSPGKCLGTKKQRAIGAPDEDHISTSFAERQNLNIRMQNRRYTRLTNGFSKKAEMLAYSIAITFMYHNFVRKHQTLRMPPALKAGVATHVWSISDMVKLADEAELDRKAS
jgi:IS1 family transposase